MERKEKKGELMEAGAKQTETMDGTGLAGVVCSW